MARDTRRSQVNYGANTVRKNSSQLRETGSGIRTPDLNVVASPVDTFVRPADQSTHNAGVRTAQLAQALSGLAPELRNLAMIGTQHMKKDAQEEAERAVGEAREEGLNYKKAVEAGILKRSDNPYFAAGVNEAFGRVEADRMGMEVSLAAEQRLQGETDASKVDAVVQELQKAWIEQNVGTERNSHFQNGFAFRSVQHIDRASSQLKERVGANLENLGFVTGRAEVRTSIMDSLQYNIPVAQIADDLNAWRGDMLAQGRSATEVDRALQEAVGAAVEDSDHSGVEQLFDLVKGKDGVALRDVFGEKSADYARNALEKSNNRWVREHAKERAMADQAKDDARENAAAEASARIFDDEHADLSDIEERLKGDTRGLEMIAKARSVVGEIKHRDDPDVQAEVLNDIWNGRASNQKLLQLYNRGSMTLKTFNSMQTELRQFQATVRQNQSDSRREAREAAQEAREARAESRAILSDPNFIQWRGNVINRMKAPTDQSFDKSKSDKVEAELTRAWVQWKSSEQGRKASPLDDMKFLEANTTAYVDMITKALADKKEGRGEGYFGFNMDGAAKLNAKAMLLSAEDIATWDSTGRLSPNAQAVLRRAIGTPDGKKIEDFIEQQRSQLNRR